ncbi:MAG: transposase [Rubrivivax sp.]|nr:transposase [Rubrivivax sp.]
MDDAKRETRRKHDAELKRQVLAECAEPGASVARVALSHGLNANLVHKWRRRAAGGAQPAAPQRSAVFVPVELTPSTAAAVAAADIRIELRRGALAVNVTWPLGASTECAHWLREILR